MDDFYGDVKIPRYAASLDFDALWQEFPPADTYFRGPYQRSRDEIRALHDADGVPFIEVHAQATVEALATRDVKGLYKKALAGEIEHFTGVTDPYEAPETPEVRVRTDQQTVSESVEQILNELRERQLISA